jgi:hypothetical protein
MLIIKDVTMASGLCSSGMWYCVFYHMSTSVSKEFAASIFRKEER